MTNKDLSLFIGKCLTIDYNQENRLYVAEQIKNEKVDWEKFVVISSNYLITPAIYVKFRNSGIDSLLPAELHDYLQEIYNLSYSRNQMLLEQIREICDLLAVNDIYPVLLKGAGNLLDDLYQDIGERIMGDIDILVKEDEYHRAAEIALNFGYQVMESEYFYDDVDILKHYPRLGHPERYAALEIHRLPVEEKYTRFFNQQMIREKIKKPVNLSGSFVLCDEHKVIINFIHSQLANKGHKSAVISMRDAYDLYLLSRRTNLDEIYRDLIPEKKVVAYFFMVEKLLGTKISNSEKSSLSAKWLFLKYNLNFDFKYFYRINRIVTEFNDRVIERYFVVLFKAIYSKETRAFVFRRMKTIPWYKSQINSWIRTFRSK